MERFIRIVMLTGFAGLWVTSCDTAHTVAPVQDIGPVASTPAAAVQRLAWAFEHRDLEAVAGLLPENATFASADVDSAGNVLSDDWTRPELLEALGSMFYGVSGVSEPANVNFQLDRNLVAFADTRAGLDPRVHKTIRSGLDLRVFDPTQQTTFEVTGQLAFYTPRGDSATIPPERMAQGERPDSTRWWIERLEDDTIGDAAGRALPAVKPSLSWLLRFYRDRARR